MHLTGALVTVASLAAVPLARAKGVLPSAVVGAMVGPVLLVSAALSLVDALTR